MWLPLMRLTLRLPSTFVTCYFLMLILYTYLLQKNSRMFFEKLQLFCFEFDPLVVGSGAINRPER